MSEHDDISRFVKDPSSLVELCRAVVDELEASINRSETSERETQLREITKTIARLVKTGVPVPDVLRAEKMRLAASLSAQDAPTRALSELADGLASIVKEVRSCLGQTQDT